MSKEYKAQELKSSEYYSNLIGLEFRPEYQLPIEKRVSKGDPIYETVWFKRKKVGEEKEDLYYFYDSEGDNHYSPLPLERFISRSAHRIVRDNKLLRQAEVVITKKSGSTECRWFNTNEEAATFLEDVKSKCNQCGNKLL